MNEPAIAPRGDELEALERLQGQGGGISGRWYWDEQVFELERRHLFASTWMFAGYAHEIPGPGDARPVDVAGEALILARDKAGVVRVFHNVCPHRGRRLLEDAANGVPVIKCPYHAWAFDLDGTLNFTPHWGGYRKHELEGFDRGCHGLKRVRSVQWHDWIFVNLDAAAPPFDAYAAEFEARFEEYDLDGLVHAECHAYEFDANWKIVQENFLEVLHLPPVHVRLSEYAPFQEHAVVAEGNCLGTVIETGLPASWADPALPRHSRVAPDSRTAKNLLLYPTFKLVIGPDHCCSMIEFPVSAGRTRQRWDFYFLGEGATDPAYEPARREVIDFFCETNVEDKQAVEGLHVGRRSSGFDGGVLSEVWEGAVSRFLEITSQHLGDGARSAAG